MPRRRRSLRDLRWLLAELAWRPASWALEQIEDYHATLVRPTDPVGRIGAVLWAAPPFRLADLPLRLRALHMLVPPCDWLSNLIFRGWAEDERGRLSYWSAA